MLKTNSTLSFLLLLSLGCAGVKTIRAAGQTKIYALKYGESTYRSNLVNTLSQERQLKFNWLFYLVEAGNPPQYTLIDTGFENAKWRSRFGLKNFKTAAELLSLVGVRPEQISRVILTHSHFDHAGNVTHFKNSNILIQAKEYHALLDRSIAPFLASVKAREKLQLIDQPRTQAGEFELIFTGGHTAGSQAVRVSVNDKTYLFTGDECYFQDACHARVPLPAASAHSQKHNKDFLKTISESDRILTGHESQLTGGHWLNDFVYLMTP